MATAGNLFNVGAGYLLGKEGEQAFGELGQQALQGGERLGQQALAASAFKPYTVTSSLANVQTTPEGGFGINLSPEQQALQTQLQGQTAGLFGQVGQDPAQAQSALYEQIRATQRPEEERQRLALQENLFASGRGGVQTAQYGGSPEQFAYEQARQEAMSRANLGARQQSQAEQAQAANLGGLLQQAGYQPQQQALSLLEGSQIPAGYLSQGQRTGATLQGQLEQSGLEGYLQAAELGQGERLAQLQNMANLVGGGGTGANAVSGLLGGLDQYLPDWLKPQQAATAPTNSAYNFLADVSGFGSANPSQINSGLMMGFSPTQIASAMNNPTSFEDNIDYTGSDYDY